MLRCGLPPGARGQLGRGSSANAAVPISVFNSGVLARKTIVALSGGFDHSLALSSDGNVYAWGLNSRGQLGNGSSTNSPVPAAVNSSGVLAGKTVTAIAAGQEHSVAMASDGAVYTWGFNNFGQLGTGTTGTAESSLVPVAVSASGALAGKSISAIAASNYHSPALASDGTVDGTVYGWGNGAIGELGNGSTSSQRTPAHPCARHDKRHYAGK